MLEAQIEEKGIGPLGTQHRASYLGVHMHVECAFLTTQDLILYRVKHLERS